MGEWDVFLTVVALVSFLLAVGAPIIKLNSAITKLNTLIETSMKRLDKLEEDDEAMQKNSRQAHQRLHDRIDGVEGRVNDHETRLSILEKGERRS